MFSWHWPWMLLLLPLPLLARRLPRADGVPMAVRVPFFDALRRLQTDLVVRGRFRLLEMFIAALVWIALVAAAARPVWHGDAVPMPRAGRDLMLAVDISMSMREEDMLVQGGYVSRIRAVKAVVGEFIERRLGDRLGLILFGQQGYLQTPLTFDTKTVRHQLEEAQLGFAGNATAIGDAIGLAIKRLRERPVESRVLILLTDGANTAGTEPRAAAKVAAEAGIRIHTVGIGADAKVIGGLLGFGMTARTSADLDEEGLRYIADTTGGKYFRARDPAELQRIYAYLDQLEPMPEEVVYRPERSLFHLPLALALAGSAVLVLLRAVALRRGVAG